MSHLTNEQTLNLRTRVLEALIAADAHRYVGEVVQQKIQDGLVSIAISIGGRMQFLGVSFDAAMLTAEQGDWFQINDDGTVPTDTVNWMEQRSLLGERWTEFETRLHCEERFRRIHLMHEWVELTFPDNEVLNQPVPGLLDQIDLHQQFEDLLDDEIRAEINENNKFYYFRRRLWRIEGWDGLWMMHQNVTTHRSKRVGKTFGYPNHDAVHACWNGGSGTCSFCFVSTLSAPCRTLSAVQKSQRGLVRH